jgi:hypothetical protein
MALSASTAASITPNQPRARAIRPDNALILAEQLGCQSAGRALPRNKHLAGRTLVVAKIAKPSAGSSVPTALPCPHRCRLPRKASWGLSNRLHFMSPSCVGTKAADPTRDHLSVTGPFCGASYSAVSDLESASPADNKPSRLSHRGCNTTRTCSRLHQTCTARSGGGAAESTRQGGHLIPPRKLRVTPVMSSNQDRLPDRGLQETKKVDEDA